MAGVSIKNLTRQHQKVVAGSVFSAIAKRVLPAWDISLVFVGSKKARALNEQLRSKTYIPNVLSYAVGDKNGEIFICLQEARKQAPLHAMTERMFILYLFIHGLLHLKGWAHGATMERCEQQILAHVTTNSNRHRHRHLPDKNGGRR
ncbi:MAG: rRNA maturation RNase YbeY, partial [Candidatus Kaiserbacteria bacterium]|nr:rRNA maturation RNase YbeY [Candidatus Kaiserbacteria bacterium]